MHRAVTYVLLAAALPTLLSGCIYSRELSQTRREIERQVPEARIEQELVLNLGPASLRFASWMAGLPDAVESDMARRYLREVKRVKVGVYSIDGPAEPAPLDFSRMPRFQRGGWDVAARVRDEGETVWVLYRENRSTIRDLFVIVYTPTELVMARVNGRVSEIVRQVMADGLYREAFKKAETTRNESEADPEAGRLSEDAAE